MEWIRATVVNVLTSLRLDDPEFESLQEKEFFLVSKLPRTSLGPTPHPVQREPPKYFFFKYFEELQTMKTKTKQRGGV
jgi:hypothetical protein